MQQQMPSSYQQPMQQQPYEQQSMPSYQQSMQQPNQMLAYQGPY
jgi:hypothetical protein